MSVFYTITMYIFIYSFFRFKRIGKKLYQLYPWHWFITSEIFIYYEHIHTYEISKYLQFIYYAFTIGDGTIFVRISKLFSLFDILRH